MTTKRVAQKSCPSNPSPVLRIVSKRHGTASTSPKAKRHQPGASAKGPSKNGNKAGTRPAASPSSPSKKSSRALSGVDASSLEELRAQGWKERLCICNIRKPHWPEEIYILRDRKGNLHRVLEIIEYFTGRGWRRYSHLSPEKPAAFGLDPLRRDPANWRRHLDVAPISLETAATWFLENHLPSEFRRHVRIASLS